MNRLVFALLFGVLSAIAAAGFFFSSYGQRLEEDVGLPLLFKIRGPRSPPSNVVIVNLDDESSERLGLPQNFSKWPRTVHAALVDRLKSCGAAVIAFDVHFAETRIPADDLAFAEAIRQAGNVVLFEELKRQTFSPGKAAKTSGNVEMDILVPPIAPLADAALALAPFPLPKIPVRINQAWTFKSSAGDMPTLPVVVLQAMALKHYETLLALLRLKIPTVVDSLPATSQQAMATLGLVNIIRTLKELFSEHPWLAESLLAEIAADSTSHLSPEERQELGGLVGMYAGEGNIYVNFYGPPATLATLSYHQVLTATKNDIVSIKEQVRDKVVFVGAARRSWSGQKDGFFTVFSQPDGLDLSGVEIAATVYANLLENKPVRNLPPGKSFALLLAWGVGTCLICFLLPPMYSGAALFVCIASYLYASNFFFTANGAWPPIIIPLGLQTPAAFLAAMLCKYVKACRERGNMRDALGLYLPDKVVKELEKDLSYINTGDQMVYGACLLTDAQRYTALSESMDPKELSRLMKEYYRYLFKPVNEKGGLICNVIGDSMLALWPSAGPQILHRESACQVALQVLTAVDQFNRQNPESCLPTRIGLHCGYLLMGNIGAENHFEYAPVGDIVNTVSRIEGLNKLLGTRILASEEAVQGLIGITTRNLGVFLFEGKTQPIVIHELLATGYEAAKGHRALFEIFPEALANFQGKKWDSAMAGFQECLNLLGEDGPSRFYLQSCREFQQRPPSADWQGVVLAGK